MFKFIIKLVLQVALAMGLTWLVQNSPINPYVMVGLIIAGVIAIVCAYVFYFKPKYVEFMASKKETGRLKGQKKFWKKNMKETIVKKECGVSPQLEQKPVQIDTQVPVDITKEA